MQPEKPAEPPAGQIEGLDRRVAFFDRQAASWDESHPPEDAVRRVRECKHLTLMAGKDVLEVGCGTGQLTGWLAEHVRPGRVTAVDFSPAMLEKARTKGIDAEFRLADVCRDDFRAGRYDVVLCFHSFPHFRDPAGALRRLAAALREDGRLIVMHLAGSAHINAFHDEVGGEVHGDHLPDADRWAELLADAGLALRRRIDREDLFFLKADRRDDHGAAG